MRGRGITRLTQLEELNLYDNALPLMSELPPSLVTLRIVFGDPNVGIITLGGGGGGNDGVDGDEHAPTPLDLTRLKRLRHLALVNVQGYDGREFGADQLRCLTGLTALHLSAFGPAGPNFLPPSMPNLVDLRMDVILVEPWGNLLPVLPDAPQLSLFWLSVAATAWEALDTFMPVRVRRRHEPTTDLGKWPVLRHLLLHMVRLGEDDVQHLASLCSRNLASLELRDCEFDGLCGMLLAGNPAVTVRDLPQKTYLEILDTSNITTTPGFEISR